MALPVEKASPPPKTGGVLTVLGILLVVIGLGMMATIALTAPGVIVLLVGLVFSAISFGGTKAANQTPRT